MVQPSDPSKADGNGGRDAAGKFTAGNKCSKGRRPRPSAWSIASQRAAESGRDIEAELWAVIDAMLGKAKDGDVQAAKLILDALTVSALEEIERRVTELEAA
jgi:hypothetical protein